MKKALFALLLGGLGIGMTEFVMMGMLPDIAANLNITIPKAGHLISAYALGVVIGAPLLVIIANGREPKKVLLVLMALFTLFNALSSLAPNFITLFIFRLLSGLPHGAFFGVGAVVASRLAEKGKEAQSVSVMFAGLTIATVIGVPFGTYLGQEVSWRYTFLVIGLIGLITIFVLQLWMPRVEPAVTNKVKDQLAFFKTRKAWLIILANAIGTGGLFCWLSYIAPLLTEVSGFTPQQVPYLLSLAGIGMFVGNIFGGRVADAYSPQKATLTLLLIMAVTLVAVALLSWSKPAAIVLTFTAGGLAFALVAPIQMLMIQTAKGAEIIAASVSQACFNMSNALGAYLGGLPLAAGYSYTSPEWVGVLMSLVGAGAMLLFILMQRRASNISEDLPNEPSLVTADVESRLNN